MPDYTRVYRWCTRCDCYRVLPGEKCLNCNLKRPGVLAPVTKKEEKKGKGNVKRKSVQKHDISSVNKAWNCSGRYLKKTVESGRQKRYVTRDDYAGCSGRTCRVMEKDWVSEYLGNLF